MKRLTNQRLARVGIAVPDAQQSAATALGACGCNSIWLPPNFNLPPCATCPEGAPNRYQVNVGDAYFATPMPDEAVFAGLQTLTATGTSCIWRSAPLPYGDIPIGLTQQLEVAWTLDLSATPVPTITLDVVTPGYAGHFGVIVYDMAAPRFGCSCPTPFRRRCVRDKFPLEVICVVCLTPPSQVCGDILIPETLTASTGSTPSANNANWLFALNYDPNAYWGPLIGHRKGWTGHMTTINGVEVYAVIDPCITTYQPPIGQPISQTEVWTNLYSRPGFHPYQLSPLLIGLRAERSGCNSNLEPVGLSYACGVFYEFSCGSICFPPFGCLPISAGHLDLTVSE